MSPSVAIDPQRPVAELVVEDPGRARIFEQFGIDYCCGGRRSLAAACEKAGVSCEEVVRQLAAGATAAAGATSAPAVELSLTDLATQIVDRHHVYLRRELPRLAQLVGKVVAAHAAAHAELPEVARVFAALEAELMPHMMKEEQVLFPIARALEAAKAAGRPLPSFHCGSVENPIAVMEDEHQHAGEALARLRSLTGDYRPPDDACPTYVALLAGLAELEADLHQHIHLENNILFPRAAALEAELSRSLDRAPR